MLYLSLSSSLISKSANKGNKSINPKVCGDQVLGKMPVSILEKAFKVFEDCRRYKIKD